MGCQTPRICVVPDGVDHPKWPEVVEFIAALGVTLDEWQLLVLRSALMRNGDVWAAFAVAVCAPRQNGKNGILEVRELIGPLLLGEKLLIHTAHLADTSKEAFRRLDDLIDANAWLSAKVKHIWRSNGHEAIEFFDGRRIRFRTRTRGGGRGFAGSPVVLDEAMFLPEVSMGSILPVVSAQPDPQVWYLGSAVDQSVMDDGVVFARVRDRAISGSDPRLAYFEWSLDAATPDDVEASDLLNMELIAQANPAFGVRISEGYVEAEYRELGTRTFAVERGGVGDWPPVDGSAGQVIPLAAWDALADLKSAIDGRLCLAFDVSPDRSSGTISAAGARADGLQHVEVIENRRGTGWIVGRLIQLKASHDVVSVVCDERSPAASLIQDLEDLGVKVTAVNSGQLAHACGKVFDLVDQVKLRHLGTQELRLSIKGAAKRPLGDAWAWSRKSSAVDISPLVSGTLALWGWSTVPAYTPPVVMWG